MSQEEFIHWMQCKVVSDFCNCSLMEVGAMSEDDFKLWYERATAFNDGRAALVNEAMIAVGSGEKTADFLDNYFASEVNHGS